MRPPSLYSFFVHPADPQELISAICSFPNKSCNLTEIPVRIFKNNADIVSKVVTKLFNETLNHGVFSDCLKIARVEPIYKAGCKNSVKNYRSISVLPFISKLFERMMYKRLISFINKMSILTPN